MVRLYGKAPYKAVLVHGGPGAIGSLKRFAEELSERSGIGVVEAIQSKYSIAGLIEELADQIQDNCSEKVSLIGHSWGAWLAVLLAKAYPDFVKSIILVGCAPLEDKYVSEIGARRMQNLAGEDCAVFQRLIRNEATDEDMKKIPEILEQADNYCPVEKELHQADRTDSRMHNEVWGEAAKLRTAGEIRKAFQQVKNRLYLIQGADDPHPAEGVTIPLQEMGVPCEAYVLDKCGHSPFMERYAKEAFYKVIGQITDW